MEQTVCLKYLKIWLDTDLKIILLDIKIIIERLSIDDNAVNSFNIPATLSILHSCFDDPNKIIFRSVFS